MQVSDFDQFKRRGFFLPNYGKYVRHYCVFFHFCSQIYDNYYRFKKIGLPQKATIPNERITHRLLKDDQASAVDKLVLCTIKLNGFFECVHV